MKKVDIDESGKLEVTLLFAYISWKKLFSHTFKTFSKKVIVMASEKIKAKYMNDEGESVKEFFT